MPRYKRSQYFLITIENSGSAQNEAGADSALVLTSLLSGEHLLTRPAEIADLAKVPSGGWMEHSDLNELGFSDERIAFLESFGVLLAEEGGSSKELNVIEDRLLEAHWPPCAAMFHLINHAQESRQARSGRVVDAADQEKNADSRAEAFLEAFGTPPAAFYEHPNAQLVKKLPLGHSPTEVSRVLRQRRTCRFFEPGFQLPLAEMAHLLEIAFGPLAVRVLAGKVPLILKTSPSGGSLHPVEAYPLFFRCEDTPSGLYHYRSDCHGLEILKEMPEANARRLAIRFAQGQSFVGSCSAIVILVARFDRNFWKYRERENSYSVVLQDVGHLSQTFQVAATDSGLGAFYTAALAPSVIVDLLDLRFPAEAPIGLLGVGKSLKAEED